MIISDLSKSLDFRIGIAWAGQHGTFIMIMGRNPFITTVRALLVR